MNAVKRKLFGLLFLCLFIVSCGASCATLTGDSEVKYSPKQQAIIWMSVYNATYDDTYAVLRNPMATPAQKEIAGQKKIVLTQMWPLIKVYVSVVESGAVPTLSQTAEITNLINQLALLAGGL